MWKKTGMEVDAWSVCILLLAHIYYYILDFLKPVLTITSVYIYFIIT